MKCELLTINEACKVLKISRNTYYRRTDKNSSVYDPNFPIAIKLGTSRRIRREELDKYMNAEITTMTKAS